VTDGSVRISGAARRRPGGRRPGRPDTRADVLVAARQTFAAVGFTGATVRQIAAAAGVDPALVHHYFGSKRQLFIEAVQAPADPAVALRAVLDGDRDGAGRRLATAFLTVWDGPAGERAVALLRSAVTDESSAALVREFLASQVLQPVLEHLGVPRGEQPLRAALLASQLGGLALTRYVLRVQPLASTPAPVVVDGVAPVLQRYLTGDLAGFPTTP
jgi:AcrR family transcriptional regulator